MGLGSEPIPACDNNLITRLSYELLEVQKALTSLKKAIKERDSGVIERFEKIRSDVSQSKHALKANKEDSPSNNPITRYNKLIGVLSEVPSKTRQLMLKDAYDDLRSVRNSIVGSLTLSCGGNL